MLGRVNIVGHGCLIGLETTPMSIMHPKVTVLLLLVGQQSCSTQSTVQCIYIFTSEFFGD